MPPIYDWKDEHTGFEIAVIRKMEESHIPPLPEELPKDFELTEKTHWAKQVSRGVQKTYSPGWGWGKKGSW